MQFLKRSATFRQNCQSQINNKRFCMPNNKRSAPRSLNPPPLSMFLDTVTTSSTLHTSYPTYTVQHATHRRTLCSAPCATTRASGVLATSKSAATLGSAPGATGLYISLSTGLLPTFSDTYRPTPLHKHAVFFP